MEKNGKKTPLPQISTLLQPFTPSISRQWSSCLLPKRSNGRQYFNGNSIGIFCMNCFVLWPNSNFLFFLKSFGLPFKKDAVILQLVTKNVSANFSQRNYCPTFQRMKCIKLPPPPFRITPPLTPPSIYNIWKLYQFEKDADICQKTNGKKMLKLSEPSHVPSVFVSFASQREMALDAFSPGMAKSLQESGQKNQNLKWPKNAVNLFTWPRWPRAVQICCK